MKRLSMLAIPAAALVATMITAGTASAYVYKTCNGNPIKWPLPLANMSPLMLVFPSGSAQQIALERAKAGWNQTVPAGLFQFLFFYSFRSTWESGDGYNDIVFTSDFPWNSGELAVTLTRLNCNGIEETDILFNPGLVWNMAHHPIPTSAFPAFVLVALHELGHAFGLLHEDRWMATMNSFYPNGGVFGNENDPDPHADDCAADRALYGFWNPGAHDLAVGTFHVTGTGTSGLVLPPSQAQRGTVSTFRLTLLNRGTFMENGYKLKVYASPDRWITTNAFYLGSATYWQTPGSDMTVDLNVYIPYSLAPGKYYFGFVLDPDNVISESAEDQNAVGYVVPTSVF